MVSWLSFQLVQTPAISHASKRSACGTSTLLRYLVEALRVDWQAPLLLGLKRSIKVGAALWAGLEHVPAGRIRLLAGRYLLYACFQLDTVVDGPRDMARVRRVHQWVRECLTGSRPVWALGREVLASRPFSLGERVKLLLLLRNLAVLVRSMEEALEEPRRVQSFRQNLSALTVAVVEDVEGGTGARDTLSALAPSYPAMGLSSLEVLWLLERELERVACPRLARELRRVVTFSPLFTDVLMAPHRRPPEEREQSAA
jgi:hypothetical protein